MFDSGVLDDIQDILDDIDLENASEAQLRSAVERISDLVAAEEEEEEEEEDEGPVEIQEDEGDDD